MFDDDLPSEVDSIERSVDKVVAVVFLVTSYFDMKFFLGELFGWAGRDDDDVRFLLFLIWIIPGALTAWFDSWAGRRYPILKSPVTLPYQAVGMVFIFSLWPIALPLVILLFFHRRNQCRSESS